MPHIHIYSEGCLLAGRRIRAGHPKDDGFVAEPHPDAIAFWRSLNSAHARRVVATLRAAHAFETYCACTDPHDGGLVE